MINERFELTTALLSLSHQNTEGEMDVARNFYKGVDLTIWVIGWLLCLPLRIVHSLLRSISPKLVSSFQPPKKTKIRISSSPDNQTLNQRLEHAEKDTKVAADRYVKEKTRADAFDSKCKTLRDENKMLSQRIKQLEKSLHKDVKDRDVSMNDLQNEKDKITAEAKGLRKKESESRKQIEALREERDDKQNQLRQSGDQITKLKESLRKKESDSRKQIEALRKERDDKQNQLSQSGDQITKLKKSLRKIESDYRKQIEVLKKERDDIRNQLSQSGDQITKLKESLRNKESDLRKQTEALIKERDDKQNQLRQSDDQITKLKESLQTDDDKCSKQAHIELPSRENDGIRKNLKETQDQLVKFKEQSESLSKKESDSRKQIEALRNERDDKQNQLNQSGDQINKLKESLRKIKSDSRKQIEVLKKERDDIRNQLSQSEDQIAKLKESLRNKESDFRKQTEALIKERDDKQNQLWQSDDQIIKLKESLQNDDDKCSKQAHIELLSRENDGIRKNLKETQDQLVKCKEQSESLCQEVKTKDDLIQSLREERDHLASVLKGAEKEVASFKNHIASLHEELSKHDAVMQENGKLWVVLNEKEQIIEKHKMALKNAEDAKEDALRRFSQSVSLRLRDNNPNIVDLSDQYRPSKLANMMSELYDNQWTDAYTYLEDNWENGSTLSETACIEFLLNVLMEIYTFCLTKLTNDWTDGLSKILLTAGSNDDTEVLKMLKDIRKNNALTQLPNVEKICVDVLQNTELSEDSSFSKHLLEDKLYGYIQECVKLCLLMAVQDPPVFLVCEGWKTRQTNTGDNSSHPADSTRDAIQNGTVEKRREFNRDSYKEYTKRGQFVEYIVWPLIYLHENGPLLSKGVAQGCDTSTIPSHEDL